jgi:LacI family transcriptional regulator
MEVNVYEVARQAGVSPATVSRVINRPELVAVPTRLKVQAVMQALGFVPNASAQALRRGRSQLIGALIPHISYSVFADFTDAVQKVFTAVGYNVMLGVHHFNPKDELRQARSLVQAGVEGLLIVGYEHDPELFETLAQKKVTYICTDVHQSNATHPSVGYDNYSAGQKIAAHLLALGHRRFAVITGNTQKNDRMAARLAGFRAQLNQAGQSINDSMVIEGDYTLADGRRGLMQLLANKSNENTDPISAIMCGNDVIALGVLLEARARGIDVPAQLSVVGFDNLEWAKEFSPALTTMSVPLSEMGTLAARALLSRIQGGSCDHALELPLELVVRETTGPVARSGTFK